MSRRACRAARRGPSLPRTSPSPRARRGSARSRSIADKRGARGLASTRSWIASDAAPTDEIELVGHVHELAAPGLTVAKLDPAGQRARIDLRVTLKLLVDRVKDVMQEIFFVRLINTARRVHDPVRRARAEDGGARVDEVPKKVP